ncbi:MAG: hypothetical protein FWD61_09435 [Phycisphaerales bacterium]|nr:hypothetical protein [Phycisphaerales bacterium]
MTQQNTTITTDGKWIEPQIIDDGPAFCAAAMSFSAAMNELASLPLSKDEKAQVVRHLLAERAATK